MDSPMRIFQAGSPTTARRWTTRTVIAACCMVAHANVPSVAAFSPTALHQHQLPQRIRTALFLSDSSTTVDTTKSSSNSAKDALTQSLSVPMTWDEMIRQAAKAVKDAAAAAKNDNNDKPVNRQIVRILLPRDATNADFGKFLETEQDNDSGGFGNADIALVPPDESWQGGIMQLYRAAAPTCERLLRLITQDTDSGLPPRITEDRSVDESGVDGVGLFATDDGGAVQCFVQPTQEIVDVVVDAASRASEEQLVLLLNPQWRQVDDALDTASQGEGFLSGLASFLGGKGGTLRQLAEAGFMPVYTLEGYVCRGANVRLLQVFGSDWSVFCERDDRESFFSVGSSVNRPTYQDVEQMLVDSDVGFKYARDIGLEPKL